MNKVIGVILCSTLFLLSVNGFLQGIRITRAEVRATSAQHTQERQFPICDTTRIPSYRDGKVVGYSINVNCETSPGSYFTYARFQRVER